MLTFSSCGHSSSRKVFIYCPFLNYSFYFLGIFHISVFIISFSYPLTSGLFVSSILHSSPFTYFLPSWFYLLIMVIAYTFFYASSPFIFSSPLNSFITSCHVSFTLLMFYPFLSRVFLYIVYFLPYLCFTVFAWFFPRVHCVFRSLPFTLFFIIVVSFCQYIVVFSSRSLLSCCRMPEITPADGNYVLSQVIFSCYYEPFFYLFVRLLSCFLFHGSAVEYWRCCTVFTPFVVK